MQISLAECADLAALEETWRALEAQADLSFFRSWTWVGCLAERRFTAPVLLEARWRDRVVALGLLNRRGWLLEPDTLWLGESGRRDLDAVFVEHNGILVASGWTALLEARCLRHLVHGRLAGRRPWPGRRVILAGVAAGLAGRLRGGGARVTATSTQVAPLVDLDAVRRDGRPYIDGLSANTRAQLRRSNRRYGESGPLTIERAATASTAHAWLDALAVLHQRTWTARDRPGAFANPSFAAFHHQLIDRGFADGTIDLLRIAAGEREIGYLYNFRHRGRISAYQSGFDYAAADTQLKPGLTSHALAIEQALAAGCTAYDFLAGDSRYKRSLANAATTLSWLELLPRCSIRGVARSNPRPSADAPTPTPTTVRRR